MKKTLGKRIISGITSLLLGLSAFSQAMPLSNGGVLKAKAVNNKDDGLPIMETPYEESMWYRGGPLGVAGDFHIFAFDTATVDKHTNGNVAAPHVIGGNASPNQYVGRLVNVIGEKWETPDAVMNNIPDVIIPKNYTAYDKSGKKISYPSERSKFTIKKGPDGEMGLTRLDTLDKTYIGHWTDKFINFKELRKTYSDLSDTYAAKEQNATVEFSKDTGTGEQQILISLNPEGENVINLK